MAKMAKAGSEIGISIIGEMAKMKTENVSVKRSSKAGSSVSAYGGSSVMAGDNGEKHQQWRKYESEIK
jgi:hypothetical protein